MGKALAVFSVAAASGRFKALEEFRTSTTPKVQLGVVMKNADMDQKTAEHVATGRPNWNRRPPSGGDAFVAGAAEPGNLSEGP